MAKLQLNKKRKQRDDDDEEETLPKHKKAQMEDDEEYSDGDFFGEGMATQWANEHAPQMTFRREFWISDDDSENIIVFTDLKPFKTILQHVVKEGKQIRYYTCCKMFRPCKFCQVAKPKSTISLAWTSFVWQIRKLKKYTNEKTGKTSYITNRWWKLSKKNTEALTKLLRKFDDPLDCAFEAIKDGGLVQKKLSDTWRERLEDAPELMDQEEFIKEYKPVSDAEAEVVINRVLSYSKAKGDADDDDDDFEPKKKKKKLSIDEDVPY